MPSLKKLFCSVALLITSSSLYATYGSCGFGSCRGMYGCSCLENIYVGVQAGFTSGIGEARNSIAVGELQNGMATNAHVLPGWHVEGRLGYEWWQACISIEGSYTFFSSNYNWEAIFGDNLDLGFATTNVFEAHFQSHIVLCTINVNLDRLCCSPISCVCVTPYLFGGLGTAWNHLQDIKEIVSADDLGIPQVIDVVASDFHSNFAGRFGLGFRTFLSDYFTFNVGVHVTYIGEVRSGNFVTFPDGTETPITPYKFRDNWLGSFFVGAQYTF